MGQENTKYILCIPAIQVTLAAHPFLSVLLFLNPLNKKQKVVSTMVSHDKMQASDSWEDLDLKSNPEMS